MSRLLIPSFKVITQKVCPTQLLQENLDFGLKFFKPPQKPFFGKILKNLIFYSRMEPKLKISRQYLEKNADRQTNKQTVKEGETSHKSWIRA